MKKLGLVIVLLCLSMAVSAGGFMFKHLEVIEKGESVEG